MDGDLDQVLLVLLGFFAALTLFLVLTDRLEPNPDSPRPPRARLRARIQRLVHRGSGTGDDEDERR